MTSANLSEEPIAYLDDEARQRLSDLADGFLMHNRPIHTRVDDSVQRVVNNQPYFLRRARGYAPDAVILPFDMPPILATGAELKNTFCLTRQQYAFISHHIGDLENFETLRSFEEGIRHYEKLFHIRPEMLAADLHPDYLATRYAQKRVSQQSLPLLQVQHHHAHLAACLADNQWNSTDPVIGLIFDGTGYGTDGAIWGGEVLLGGYAAFERAYHLAYIPLPGGDAAVRNPGRMALAYLKQAGIQWNTDLPPVTGFSSTELSLIQGQIEKHINSPLTSSMGRLFDAVSALLGICQQISYEGQAAIELEALADFEEEAYYPIDLQSEIIDVRSLWDCLVRDFRNGISTPLLAARFHNSIAQLGLQVCENLRSQTGIDHVALSGGVWQNIFLLNRTVSLLSSHGFKPLLHQRVPANDGGIALGQAVIASFYQ
jgi:hydrogenase maturation protein HypF